MFKQYSTYRLILMFALVLLFLMFDESSIYSQDDGPVFLPLIGLHSQHGPISIDFGEFEVTAELRAAIWEAISQRPNGLLEGSKFAIMSGRVDPNWHMYSIVSMDGPESSMQFVGTGESSMLLIVHHDPVKKWKVGLAGTQEFSQLIDKAPESFISSDAKRYIDPIRLSASEHHLSNVAAGYKFPWAAGNWQYRYGWHESALDIGTHGDDRRVLAAADGYIATICRKGTVSANVKIVHFDGRILEYYHFDKNKLEPYIQEGRSVTQGQVLGVLLPGTWADDCGYTEKQASYSVHVHWKIPLQSGEQFSADGWTIQYQSNTWHRGTETRNPGSSLLPSTNNPHYGGGGSCPAPTLISPTDGQTLSSRTVNFSWQVLSGCGGYTFRVKDTNNMDSGGTTIFDNGIGETSTTKTFDAQWDNRDLYWGVKAAGVSSASWSTWRFRIQPSGGSTCGDPGSNEVVIFANTNHGGNCKKLGIGNYPTPSNFSPVGNDDIESIKVGSNVQLELCAHDNYGTPCSTFTANDANLGNSSIGANNASSAKVSTRGTSSGSWTARYYDDHTCWGNTNCSQSPRCTETIGGPNLDKNWGTNAPCSGMDGDTWIGDFQATINFPAGNYVFQLEHDDGAKLWVEGENNNNPIQDRGTVESGPVCPPRYLSGNRNVRVQLREDGGDARIKLIRTTDESLCLPDAPPVPVLNAPSNDSKFEYKDNILLRWNSSNGATSYHVEYNRDSGDALQSKDTSSLFWNLGSGQLGIGRYSWRVNASNAGGVSPWSGNWYFTVIPNRPLALTAAALSDSQIALSWTRPSGSFDNFRIYREDISSPLTTVGASSTTYTVSGLTCGTQYTFLVTAYVSGGYESPYSNGVIATTNTCPPQVPAAPTLSAPANGSTFAHQSSVPLRWNSSQNATQYQVEYAHNTGTILVPAQSSLELTFNSGQLAVSDYSWRVRAGNASGWSAWSALRNFTVRPNQPTNLAAQPVTASQIALAWTNPGGDLDGFKIYVNGQSTPHATVGSNASTYTYSGATCGISYSFQVKAYKVNVTEYQSTPSNMATASTTCPSTPKVNVKVAFQGRSSGSQPDNVPIKLQIKNASGTQNVWETANWVSVTPDGSGSRGAAVIDVASAGLTTGQTYRFYVRGAMHLDKLVTAQYSDGMMLDLTNSAVNPDGILWACDINQDNVVNILDHQLLSNHYGAIFTGPPDPNSVIYRSDGNGDGFVNILDNQICSNSFGKVGNSVDTATQTPTPLPTLTSTPTLIPTPTPTATPIPITPIPSNSGELITSWEVGAGTWHVNGGAQSAVDVAQYASEGSKSIKLAFTSNPGWSHFQYNFPATLDLSSYGKLQLHVINPGTPLTIKVSVPTGPNWAWHVSPGQSVPFGSKLVEFDLRANNWTIDSSTGPIANLNQAQGLVILIEGAQTPNALYVDNLRKLPVTTANILYLSTSANGTVNGIKYADEDVLAFNLTTRAWSLVIDGSDIGLASFDIDAVDLQPDGTFLLSLDKDGTIPGYGAVGDEDILRFTPTSLGNVTAGSFSMYFDGSDVGLTTSAEDVDAFTVLADGRLLISTLGNAKVTGVTAQDKDLLVFTPSTLGSTTTGTWAMYFDGSDVGLTTAQEDIWGVNVGTGNTLYLTTLGPFAVNGLKGDGADIFICTASALGDTTACTFSMYWDGSANGLGGKSIDAFHITSNTALAQSADSTTTPADDESTVEADDDELNGNAEDDAAQATNPDEESIPAEEETTENETQTFLPLIAN